MPLNQLLCHGKTEQRISVGVPVLNTGRNPSREYGSLVQTEDIKSYTRFISPNVPYII